MSQLRRRSDARLDDDALLMTMARAALHGPSDEGRSSYQISLCVCPECGRGAQLAAGELVPVAPEATAMAECDGQHIGSIATTHGTPPTPANDAHVDTPNAHAHAGALHPPRAKQTIPPAQRRMTLQRDQRRCRVPGCCNATFVDVHHITPRADGGSNDSHNLIVLCSAHHRAVHRGELIIEGTTAADLRFRHADGSRYGEAASPTQIDVQTKVFQVLCKLGFREGEVRRGAGCAATRAWSGGGDGGWTAEAGAGEVDVGCTRVLAAKKRVTIRFRLRRPAGCSNDRACSMPVPVVAVSVRSARCRLQRRQEGRLQSRGLQ